MKNKPLPRRLMRHVSAVIPALALTLALILPFCGLTALAAEEGSPDLPQPAQETQGAAPAVEAEAKPAQIASPPAVTAAPTAPPEDEPAELYPADVQTVTGGDTRQIVKTYALTAEQNPSDIPRDAFERDGWRYGLTDITEKRVTGADVKTHTETVTVNTESKDLNAIIAQLAPTLDYRGGDGYAGVLTLELSTVKCEEAGRKTSGFTVTTVREYPHLSNPDLSLIPKTVTENGRTLNLEDVSWEAQNTVNVDYDELPSSYRAVAKYTASASKTIVTGYVTTADYVGEIAKAVTGDTVYTAYFEGKEINPKPTGAHGSAETPGNSPMPDSSDGALPVLPIASGFAALALLGGAGAFLSLRRNVKIYVIGEGDRRALAAKARISAKNPSIDLSPLNAGAESRKFSIEIERPAAKSMNGKTVEVRYGPLSMKHKIAYEGNPYKLEADFRAGTVNAVY